MRIVLLSVKSIAVIGCTYLAVAAAVDAEIQTKRFC